MLEGVRESYRSGGRSSGSASTTSPTSSLRSQHPCRQGRGLRQLSRARRRHAAHWRVAEAVEAQSMCSVATRQVSGMSSTRP